MEKRAILAVLISMLILSLWARFFAPPSRESVKQAPPRVQEIVAEARSMSEKSKKEVRRVAITTRRSRIVLTSDGGRAEEWAIKEKTGEVDVILAKVRERSVLPFALRTENAGDFSRADFELQENLVEGDKEKVTFEQVFGNLRISKIYSIARDGYVHNFTVKIKNESGQATEIGKLTILWEAGLGIEAPLLKENMKTMKVQGKTEGRIIKKLKPGEYSGKIEWVAITNRYFLASFLNTYQDFCFAQVGSIDKEIPVMGLSAPAGVLSPGETKSFSLDFVVAPKDYKYLKTLGLGMERTVDFGLFGFLSIVFLAVLNFFYRLTGNYGLSIILLTCVLQCFTFPLTRKSLKSMEAMRSLQPKMNELRIKYKDDPKRLNIEIMNLYRSRKINPFGGCLPMFLQIPIFWALFTMLRNAVELRHSPFIFWIKDLSAKDPHYVLPILMGVTMFLQQKLTSSGDPTQSRMMVFMPVLFTVIFINFPAGLVLYWLMNNIFTLLTQLVMVRKK